MRREQEPIRAPVASFRSPKIALETDITLVTQCSVDRLPNLRVALQSWTGAVALALYGASPSEFEEFCSSCDSYKGGCR